MMGQFPVLLFPSLKAWDWFEWTYRRHEGRSFLLLSCEWMKVILPKKLFIEIHKDRQWSSLHSHWVYFPYQKASMLCNAIFRCRGDPESTFMGLTALQGQWLFTLESFWWKTGSQCGVAASWMLFCKLIVCSSKLMILTRQLIQSLGCVHTLWNPYYQIS